MRESAGEIPSTARDLYCHFTPATLAYVSLCAHAGAALLHLGVLRGSADLGLNADG
jgi:hypothetical protein